VELAQPVEQGQKHGRAGQADYPAHPPEKAVDTPHSSHDSPKKTGSHPREQTMQLRDRSN